MYSDANATFPGHFYDGQSAMAHKVIVRFSTNMLVLSDADGVVATWTYVGLIAPEPVAPNKSTRLSHADSPSARLVVDDPAFAEGVLGRATHLSVRERRTRNIKIVAACFAAAVILVGIGYVVFNSAPRLIAGVIPDGWRTRIGAQTEQIVVAGSRLCTAAEGQEAIDVLRQLLAVAEASELTPRISVYDIPMNNAFALPGGTIIVSREMIETAESADAIAGVLAHEYGHVIERDPETQLVRALGLSLVVDTFLGNGSSIGEAIGSAAGFLTLMRYSRAAERRADEHAVSLMQLAGIDPSGLVGFFHSVQDQEFATEDGSTIDTLIELTSSHPGLEERIGALEDLDPWPATPALTAEQWNDLQHICDE
jgi:Zn-dependent protease with chaperone function